MTLRFYHLDTPTLLRRCREALDHMGYQLLEQDSRAGILRASREEPAGATTALLDLKISRDPDGLQLLVMSGLRSNVFGIIRYDPAAEADFVEQVLFQVEPAVVRLKEFRLSEADYAIASGF